jgi:hypothetical protein
MKDGHVRESAAVSKRDFGVRAGYVPYHFVVKMAVLNQLLKRTLVTCVCAVLASL